LYAALRSEGVEPTTDISVLQQPFDMSMLLNREADSVQAKTYNEYAQLLESVNPETGELYQPEDFSVIDFQELGYGTLEDGIYAQDKWLEEGDNADVAARFLAASYEGWAFCRDDADACVDIVVAKGSALGKSHQAWMMNEVNKLIWPSTEGIGVMSAEAWDRTIKGGIDGEVLTEEPSEGAYRTDINDAALALLDERGVDLKGEDWKPAEIELTEGGK
jgi:NitT/TauT family transport system substrate-binding protein